MKIAAILPAGGSGSRMGADKPKQFLEVDGKPLFQYAVQAFLHHPLIDEVVLVCPRAHMDFFHRVYAEGPVKLAEGGAERWLSVQNGVAALDPDIDAVLVHDVARPFISAELISKCVESLQERGATIVASKAVDTVKQVDDSGRITMTHNRDYIWLAQTPQAFKVAKLKEYYQQAQNEQDFNPTDEASLAEHYGDPVFVVPGDRMNEKITYVDDLDYFKKILED